MAEYTPTFESQEITKIHTSEPGEYKSCICAVNDNEAVCGGENCLVMINLQGYIKKVKIDYCPEYIAVTQAREVFYTERDGTSIKKFLLDGNSDGEIPVPQSYKTRGLCITSQGDLLVCLKNSDDDKALVVRMTTTGDVKQTIEKNKNQEALFQDPEHVAENINGDVVVLDDVLVVVNKRGEYRYTYPDSSQSSFDRQSSIACDNTGCILVNDHHNTRVHQIDMYGRFIQFILTKEQDIRFPRGLSIDIKGRLWVCNNSGYEVMVCKYRS